MRSEKLQWYHNNVVYYPYGTPTISKETALRRLEDQLDDYLDDMIDIMLQCFFRKVFKQLSDQEK